MTSVASTQRLARDFPKRVTELLGELRAAAVCFGALSHPKYDHARKDVLVEKAQKRLNRAATAYHKFLLAASFVTR